MFKRSIFNFEFKVIALMLVTFFIVIVTGVAAYLRFSNLLENISESVRPDNRLVFFHTLKNDLTELASLAKTHTLTEDDSYRKNYVLFRKDIENKLIELRDLNEKENNEINIGLLDTLIGDRLIVLDGIMYGEDPFRVQAALVKVVVNLKTSETEVSNITSFPEQTKNREDNKDVNTTIKDEIELDLIKESQKQLQGLEKEEGKLLKKIKRAEKKNNTFRVAELDSLLKLRKIEAVDIHKKLTKVEEHARDKAIAIDQIYKGIEDVSTEELLIEKEIKQAQLELISMDNLLSLRISRLFDEFELSENAKIAEATNYAENENKKMNSYVALFSVFVAILMLLMVYIIIQYVKKNNLYKTALKRSNNEAEKLIKTREKLMATISHEIRTPMHAISGFAEQLSKEQLSEKQNEYLSMIRKSSEHLTYLINDVLDFSKLQSGKLKLDKQSFNLRELVNDVISFSMQLVQDGRISVEVKIDPSLSGFYLGDVYRLRQILLNLMGNAVKFTEKGCVSLIVTLEAKNGSEETIKIIVEDTGIGMSDKELEKVFAEFEQFGTDTKSKVSGTGLGLSITKKLVELHKGDIHIKSEKEKGTRVEVVLNLEISASPEPDMTFSPKKLKVSSVLIVDDEEYNRKLLKAMLGAYGIRMSEAENGREAIDILMSDTVELILLDSRMPVMNGWETIQAIKQLDSDTKKHVKIILLTAAGNETDDVLEQVNGYVSKPFSEESLINEINRVFGGESVEKSNDQETVKKLNMDFTNLKSLSGNDKVFYADMLNTFIATTSVSHKNIKVAFSNNDWELIANEAHKIASPCKHIGATVLHGILKEIEQSAREKQKTTQLKNQIKGLDKEVYAVLKVVNEELATIH